MIFLASGNSGLTPGPKMPTETGISLPFVKATVCTAGYNSVTKTSAFRLMDFWLPAFRFLKCHSKMVKSDFVSRFSASFLAVTPSMLAQFAWARAGSNPAQKTYRVKRSHRAGATPSPTQDAACRATIGTWKQPEGGGTES